MAGDAQNFVKNAPHQSVDFGLSGDRLIALELRPRRLGFAVFEGATTLLDWGVRAVSGELDSFRSVATRTIDRLIDLYAPRGVVARARNVSRRTPRKEMVVIVRDMKSVAARRSIEMHLVELSAIQRFYSERGLTTKHQIAMAVADWFEELSWKLPPKRRLWQSEPYNSLIFDAVGTAVAFMASDASE